MRVAGVCTHTYAGTLVRAVKGSGFNIRGVCATKSLRVQFFFHSTTYLFLHCYCISCVRTLVRVVKGSGLNIRGATFEGSNPSECNFFYCDAARSLLRL
jgi:hypothetical protein